MFGGGEILIFEDEKTFFEQKVSEMEAAATSTSTFPTPPSTADDAGYTRPALKRARPKSGAYGNMESPNVEMEEPSSKVDWDPV